MTKNEKEFLNGTTDDKGKYTKAWNAHIEELTSLGMPLTSFDGSLYLELKDIQSRLKEMVKIAADVDFG